MRTLPWVAGVVLLCTWLGPAVLAQDKPKGTPLTGAELKTLIGSGALFDWERPSNGEKGTTLYLGNGQFHIVYFIPDTGPGGGIGGNGTWRIQRDTVCTTPANFLMVGKERCRRVYLVGDNRYEARLVPSGALNSVFSVRR
jgi:hypothetical protein